MAVQRSLVALLWLVALQAPGAAPAQTTLRDDRGTQHTLAAAPTRIVSLLPSLTETVCSLGGCDRLVGTDRFSNWPASVRALPKLGGLDDAQIERIVALKPDLVLAAGSTRAIPRLEGLGLRVLALEPRSLADTRRVIHQLALALGDPVAGDALWQRIEARMRAAAERVPPALRGQRVYVEVDTTPYAAGDASFVGETLARPGAGQHRAGFAGGPFPKLNPEYVVRAQPDIVMATAQAIAEMPRRPGWASLQALRDGRTCGFANGQWDLLMRPGPRLAAAAEQVAVCLAQMPAMPAMPATLAKPAQTAPAQ